MSIGSSLISVSKVRNSRTDRMLEGGDGALKEDSGEGLLWGYRALTQREGLLQGGCPGSIEGSIEEGWGRETGMKSVRDEDMLRWVWQFYPVPSVSSS